MKKIHVSSQFRPQGAQTIIFFDDISAVMGLKIEKVGPSFSSFNPCPSLSFIATGDRKPSQSLNKVLLHFFKNMQILKFKSQQTFAFFTAINHFSWPLRTQNLTSSKGHGLWLVVFDPLCVSVVQGSLLAIVIMIDGSKKKNSCESGFGELYEKCSKWQTEPLFLKFNLRKDTF